MYVDDLLLFPNKAKLTHTKREIASKYEMCDLGKAQWSLMMEITCDWVA